MKSSNAYLTARIRAAIFSSAGLVCLGFAFGAGGLLAAGAILLFMAYWESGDARIAKAEKMENEAIRQEREREMRALESP